MILRRSLPWLVHALIALHVLSASFAATAFSTSTHNSPSALSSSKLKSTTEDPQHEIDPSSFPAHVQAAIIGGGLGGLAVCAALRRRGIDAHVYEAAPQLLRGSTGTGIMVSPNGMAALGAIDPALPDRVRKEGSRISRQHIRRTGLDGERVGEPLDFEMRTGQVNIGWSRAQEILAEVVVDEVEAVVHCGACFQSYAEVDGEESMVEITFEDGRVVRTQLLIGCDGAGSQVRQFMAHSKYKYNERKAAKTYASRYSGQLLWNAIVPSSAIAPSSAGHAPNEVEYILTGEDGKVVLAFDAGPDTTSWYLTLMEESTSLPPGIKQALTDGAIGGFGPRPGLKDELKAAFAHWPMAIACLDATTEAMIFERRLSDRVQLPGKQWSACNGRVVLMGDAAHPMVPSQGQGTMMTWEDAAELAACVAPAFDEASSSSSLAAAIQKYVRLRSKRCAVVQKYSADAYMGRTMPSFFPRKILRGMKSMRTMKYIKNGYEPSD